MRDNWRLQRKLTEIPETNAPAPCHRNVLLKRLFGQVYSGAAVKISKISLMVDSVLQRSHAVCSSCCWERLGASSKHAQHANVY